MESSVGIKPMATICHALPRHCLFCCMRSHPKCVSSFCSSSVALFTPLVTARDGRRLLYAVKTAPDGSSLLRKPLIPANSEKVEQEEDKDDETEEVIELREDEDEKEEEMWVDWEDQILEDTVPLVNFVRMILHSGMYQHGDRLKPDHEKTIVEKLLPYHPEFQKKIGSGIDYITIGFHPDFNSSRCLFVVQKNGQSVDFSYWKCIKGLIRKNYPLFADSFILRHFGSRAAI